MTDLRVDLTDKADKKLTLYKVYKDLNTKQEAIISILENLDVGTLGDEYFLKKDKKVKA